MIRRVLESEGFMDNQKGFSLIEAILVIVIVSVIAITIGVPFLEGVEVWDQIDKRKNLVQQGRSVMDRMVREIQATQRLGNNTPNIIEVNSVPCIHFTTVTGETILYRLDGMSLDRATGGSCGSPSSINRLADNVSNFTMVCFDNNNTVLSPCAGNEVLIRRIQNNLSFTKAGETLELNNVVTLRNLVGL